MNKTYSVSEAAKRLGYSKNSIYSFLKEGLIKSSRIGNGKFRIPEAEITRFLGDKSENKNTTVGIEKQSAVNRKEEIIVPQSVLLPPPRPGKSLADLSREPLLHTLRLWFVERVGFPKLFDWLVSLTSIILGLSLYLYSNQLDILSFGRLSLWMNPIRIGMILGGFGLILAAMIQGEVSKYFNLTNMFRYILAAAFLGLAIVLLIGGDIDGFLIHGLFGLAILTEAFTELRSSMVYMLYVFGLLISILIVYRYFPESSSLYVVISRLSPFLKGANWVMSLFIVLLFVLGLYGYFWNKVFMKKMSFVYGVLLCGLALYYGAGSFWTRSFAILMVGIVGMILPNWEMFKARLTNDRSLVFKMFGTVLMCFVLSIILISLVQGALMNNTYVGLQDKAALAKVEYTNTIEVSRQGLNELAKNKSFISAFGKLQSQELTNQIRFLTLGRTDVAMVVVANSKGKSIAAYPSFSVSKGDFDFANSGFFTDVLRTGNSYVSSDLETIVEGIDKVLILAVPILNTSNDGVAGVLVMAISGYNLSNDLQRIGQGSLGQQVMGINDDTKVIIHPDFERLGTVVSEGEGSYELWKNNLPKGEGYNQKGVHSLFGASVVTDLGLTIVVSEPIEKVLNIISPWMVWLLLMQTIIVITVVASFIFSNNQQTEGRA